MIRPRLSILFYAALMVLAALFMGAATAQAQSSQQTLNQYVADLQKSPNDYALREKIIKHVQTMKQQPVIPEEARRHFIEGNTLLKAAKDQRGYGLARDAYRQCLLVAPWWADAYNNYAVALELSGQFDDAVNALKLYIATNPGESESRKAQDKIYEIGAKKKLAAQEKAPPRDATAAPKQNAFEDLLRKIDGRRYTDESGELISVLDVRGRVIVRGCIDRGRYNLLNDEVGSHLEIKGRETSVPLRNRYFKVNAVSQNYIISEDGDRITIRTRWSDGDSRDYVHFWRK